MSDYDTVREALQHTGYGSGLTAPEQRNASIALDRIEAEHEKWQRQYQEALEARGDEIERLREALERLDRDRDELLAWDSEDNANNVIRDLHAAIDRAVAALGEQP